MLLERLRPRTRTRPNPLFFAERFRSLVGDDRADRALQDEVSVDLLTWNVFESLDTDADRDYLAHVLTSVGGPALSAPLRIALYTGRDREPQLRPSAAYVAQLRERVGESGSVEEFLAPIEVPVRIESPGVVALVETTLDELPRGAGGRDRLVELVDAGLEHARYLQKDLVVTVVYRSGSRTAGALSASVNRLRDPEALASALPWRDGVGPVQFREVSWQQLLQVWHHEQDNLRLFGQPARQFLRYCEALGLR